jgi:MoaA/NifB/PqqE/SkfB family radical SAM enzyme
MKEDFTSAATFPIKMFHNPIIKYAKIIPYHVTLIPTNVCNANCEECFCYKRDKKKQMSYNEICKIIDMLKELGTKAISLSGGGEPDCHPDINKIIIRIKSQGMDVALVSNGEGLDRINTKVLNLLTWIRVSGTTSRPINIKKVLKAYNRAKKVDWGCSYILGDKKDYVYLIQLINFVNNTKMTHLRVVSDMKEPNNNRIPQTREYLRYREIDDSKVIWQERTTNEIGRKKCMVPLLHPIIDVDGNVQPCCGIHFATNPPTYDFSKQTAICNWRQYPKFIEKQYTYDGSKCMICQYAKYNECLDMLKITPKHKRFI